MADRRKETHEIGRPWNLQIKPEIEPIYTMKCIIIIGKGVTVSKSHYIDDQGSELREGTKGVIQEVRITKDRTLYSIMFEEVHWVFEDMGGVYGSVEASTLWYTVEEMDAKGIKVDGRDVK